MANTLLDLISGGRYSTSEDLPTIPEMGHSYIDQIINAYEGTQAQERQVVGPGGLGMLEWAGGPTKAMAMLATPEHMALMSSKLMEGQKLAGITAKTAKKQVMDLIENVWKKWGQEGGWVYSRESMKPGSSLPRSLARDFPAEAREIDATKAIIGESAKETINSKALLRVLEQFSRRGYANPVPIQKFKK